MPKRACAGCGKKFLDKSRTSPRSYCYECRPVEVPKPQPTLEDTLRLTPTGQPFTLPHFRAWAQRLELQGGKRFKLEPFQARYVADVFKGYKECWLIIPEGNGKTTLLSLIALYHCQHRAEAWVPIAAAARDQGLDLIYRIAEGFVLRNQRHLSMFSCHPGLRTVRCNGNRSALKIYAADAATGDGAQPTLAIIDELHRHKNTDLYRTWVGKLYKEAGAQMLTISTAGEPGGEFEELRAAFRQGAAKRQQRGCYLRAAGKHAVLHEYALPEDGDPEDLKLVLAANPFSGVTLEVLKAKRALPSWNLGHWRRFTCNLPTRSATAAIEEAEWFARVAAEPIPEGELVWVGLDLGWKHDTTAAVPLWVPRPEYRQLGPAQVVEPPGSGQQTHPDDVKAALLAIHERNPIATVVMDMTNGADIAAWVEDELGVEVVDRSQMNPARALDYKRFMEALRQGWLWHAGDEALTRHALNAVGRVLPGGDIVFERPAVSRTNQGQQRRRVIDALVAAAMAHTSAVAELEADLEEDPEPMVAWA